MAKHGNDDSSRPASGSGAGEGTRTLVLCYGSNSTPQLRARVFNPSLETKPARLLGFERVFCYESTGWGGGAVSSVAPSATPGACVYGAVVSLSDQELAELDKFEGAYRKEPVTVLVGYDTDDRGGGAVPEPCAAIAYVAGGPPSAENGLAWTPPMSVEPKEEYLVAIHGMLREHWPPTAFSPLKIASFEGGAVVNAPPILPLSAAVVGGGGGGGGGDDSGSGSAGPVVSGAWEHPGAARLLRLEALCVEVSLRRKEPWIMPRTIKEVVGKLASAGVRTVADLAAALRDDPTGASLNACLAGNGHQAFSAETIGIMTGLLLA